MPLNADTNATTDISLPTDEHLPADTRPAFVSRFLSYRETREVERLHAAALAENDDAKCFDIMWKALTIGIVGWRNFIDPKTREPLVEFTPANVHIALSDAAMWWLLKNYPLKLSAAEHDRFLSPSPQRSAPATSAADAQPVVPSPAANSPKPTSKVA